MDYNIIINIIENIFGRNYKHNVSTGQIAVDCPECANDKGLIHGDGKKNLEINYIKGVYKCWACEHKNNMHGNIYKLISTYGTVEQLKLFKEYYTQLQPKQKKNINVNNQIELPSEFQLLTDNTKSFFGQKALKYLKIRGLTNEQIEYYRIGFCDNGEFKNRIIIPSYDKDNKLNYFTSRVITKYEFPKYKNSNNNKNDIIFNEYLINWDSPVFLVEGVFDHFPIPNSIPLLGKTISKKLYLTLFDIKPERIIILLDNDAYDDMLKMESVLNNSILYNSVYVIFCPPDLDVGLIYEYLGNDGIKKLLCSAIKLKDFEKKLTKKKNINYFFYDK